MSEPDGEPTLPHPSPRIEETTPVEGTLAADPPSVVPGYEILEELGRGGMGVVYRARQVALNRVVALKMILSAGGPDGQARARFLAEAEAAARLVHANVVRVYEVGEHGGVPFLCMEYCPGGSLAERLVGQPWTAAQAAALVETLARALQAAHEAGVIHRDIKPANILLAADDTPKVGDFGLARRVDTDARLTATGVILGTPSYMPPEQAAGRNDLIGPTSDVYSLGAVLYELLTGRPPFRAATLAETLGQVLGAEPAPPRLLNPAIPRDLETVVLKCLRKEPDGRYQTALALADDLRAFQEGRPVAARPPGVFRQARRWLASHPLGGGAAAAMTALLLVFALALHSLTSAAETARISVTIGEGQAGDPVELPLVGELLHPRRDEPLAPRFSVPTVSPLVVPAGPCRLRLTRAGSLGGTYWLAVRPRVTGVQSWQVVTEDARPRVGPDPGHRLVLPNAAGGQHVWPRPLHGLSWYETAPEVHTLVALTHEQGAILRGYDAATGKARWSQPVAGGGPLATAWGKYFHPQEDWTARRRLARGDAVLLASAWTVTVLAVSAKTGNLLWTHAGSAPLAGSNRGTGTVLALGPRGPAAFDANADGVPDVLALVLPASDSQVVSLQALCGRTGVVLWSHDLPRDRRDPRSLRANANTSLPTVIRSGGRAVAVCVYGDRLVGVDARTGMPAWPARDLGGEPVHPPSFADLDGDGEEEALILREPEEGRLTLSALVPARSAPLWERSWPGVPEPLRRTLNRPAEGSPSWPLVADLDGNGLPEVAVRRADFRKGQLPDRSGEWKTGTDPIVERMTVMVLEGTTGAVRWETELGRSCAERIHSDFPLRLLAGPDVDGDGRRELFVASLVHPWRPELHQGPVELFVDALSGADGHRVWTWGQRLGPRRFPENDIAPDASGAGLGPLRWWPVAPDRASLLAVPLDVAWAPTQEGQGEGIATYLLGSDGRLRHRASSFRPTRVADLDGDGWPDLLGWKVEGAFPSPRTSLVSIRGTTPAVLAAAGRWRPGKSIILDMKGGDSRIEEEPSPVQEPDPPEDNRRLIPLPWARPWGLRSQQDEEYLEQYLVAMAVSLVPLCILGFLVGRWVMIRKRERLKALGTDEAELRRQSRRGWRAAILLAVLAGALTAGVGYVCLALDRELAPGERYIWTRWYVFAIWAWGASFTALCLLLAIVTALRRRLTRRPKAVSDGPA